MSAGFTNMKTFYYSVPGSLITTQFSHIQRKLGDQHPNVTSTKSFLGMFGLVGQSGPQNPVIIGPGFTQTNNVIYASGTGSPGDTTLSSPQYRI